MDWLSLIILVFIGFMGIVGLRKGLVRQVLGLAGLVAAVVLACRYYEPASVFIVDNFHATRGLANTLGFAAVFLAVVVAVSVVGWGWGRLVKYSPVSVLDAAGGALFGIAKGAVIVAVVLLVVYSVPLEGVRQAIDQSTIAREFVDKSPVILGRVEEILPSGIPRMIGPDRRINQPDEPVLPPPGRKTAGRDSV